jgi:hypothetical protein
MTGTPPAFDELNRIKRVADVLCTAHAGLFDRYDRRALLLDVLILGVSTWLVALAFVEPKIGKTLTPFGLDGTIWIGLLAVGVFFLTIVQLKTDWKRRASAHKRALETYSEVKREAAYVISASIHDPIAHRRIIDRYDMASVICITIPEREFVRQKRRHLVKVAISKHLDSHPLASIRLTQLRLWWRDNFHKDGK